MDTTLVIGPPPAKSGTKPGSKKSGMQWLNQCLGRSGVLPSGLALKVVESGAISRTVQKPMSTISESLVTQHFDLSHLHQLPVGWCLFCTVIIYDL